MFDYIPAGGAKPGRDGALRATFADSGTQEGLLRTLRQLQDQAIAWHDELGPQAEDYLTTGGPFPERLHIIALIGQFIAEHLAHLERWARWASEQVEAWPAVGGQGTPNTTASRRR